VPKDVIQKIEDHLGEELEDIPQGKSLGGDKRIFLGIIHSLSKPQEGKQAEQKEHKKGHGNLVGKVPQERNVGKPGKRRMFSHHQTPFRLFFSDSQNISKKIPMTSVEMPTRKATGFTLP
jgi:hypothetical protein